MKPEQGRLALGLANVVLVLGTGGLVWRTFFIAHKPPALETPDRLDPQAFQVAVAARRNKADEYASISRGLDRPKQAGPPPATVVPAPGPAKVEDLNSIFQVVGVAISKEDETRSSVVLQRKSSGPDPNAQVWVKVGGEKLEGVYECTKIVENADGTVTVTILTPGGQSCPVKFSPEK